MIIFPPAVNCTIIFLVNIVGATLSSTVTIEFADDVLPFASIAVNLTVFAPISEHKKVVLFKLRVCILQASKDPLFTCAAVMITFPPAVNCTVIFFVNTVGATGSSTETVAFAVDVFPFASVAVNLTVFAPISEQMKVDLLKL